MKNSTRKVSMLLAVLMVLGMLSAFPAMTAMAATNYATGLTPTVTLTTDGSTPTLAGGAYSYLTDGVKPGAAVDASATNSAQLNGTSNIYYFVYDLGAAKSIQSVAVYTKISANRGFDTKQFTVELSSDGSAYTAVTGSVKTGAAVEIKSGESWTEFTFAFTSAQSGRYVRLKMAPGAYVLQPSEIEILDTGADNTVVSSSTEDPTLVSGNYAYGGTYTIVRDDGAAVAYRSAQQTDTGSMWTDGYEGTGAAGGTNYYTAAVVGTSKAHTITLTMKASHNDVGYVQFKNAIFLDGNAQFQDAIINSIKVSADGLSYTGVTATSEVVAEENGAHTITYSFTATTAQYIEINFTTNTYVAGWDEIIVGAGYVNPDPDPNPIVPSTVVTSTSAVNYALASAGAYYSYVSASKLPANYPDDKWSRLSFVTGKFGTGDLNDGTYATTTYGDAAWVGFDYSAQYDTNDKLVVLEFDLAKLVGDLDLIVINSLTYGGEEDVAQQCIVSQITVEYGDINKNYGSAITAVGAITDTDISTTDKVGTAHKAEFGVKGPATGARYVRISIPKEAYRLFIDEIEIIGGSGTPENTTTSTDSSADSSVETSSGTTSSDDGIFCPSGNTSHTQDRYLNYNISAQYGTFDVTTYKLDATVMGIGTQVTYPNFTGIKVTISVTDIVNWNKMFYNVKQPDGTYKDEEQTSNGIVGTSFNLYFDEANLTPLFADKTALHGGFAPYCFVNFPTYTDSSLGITKYNFTPLCPPYSMADGSTTDPSNANQQFTKGSGYIRNDYTIDGMTYPGVLSTPFQGVNEDNAYEFVYYFSVAEGSEGKSFTFDIPDYPSEEGTNDGMPRAVFVFKNSYYDGFAHVTGPATVTIPEAVVEHTVTFVDKDGATIETVTVQDGQAATAPAAPAVEGYTFTGWSEDFTAVTADMTVKALYSQIMINVTFAAGNGGTLTGGLTAQVPYGTDLSTLTFPTPVASEGYEFDAWSATSGALKADTTVTASFKEVAVADFFVFADTADTTYITVDETAGTIVFKAGPKSVEDFTALFVDSNLTFADQNGASYSTATAGVGTNAKITSTINGQTSTLTVLVYGDVDGNGKVNMADYMKIKNAVKATTTETVFVGNFFTVANVDGNSKINMADYMKVKNFVKESVANF